MTLPKLLRFSLLSKNASATCLESHSCKNKGLKVPCFHTLTKKGVGEGAIRRMLSSRASPRFCRATRDRNVQRVTNHNPRITSHQITLRHEGSRITNHFP